MEKLTVRQLRDRSGRLYLGCGCGWSQWFIDLEDAPADLLDWTIRDLHRTGRWTCPRCRSKPAAMVYVHDGGTLRQTERYTSDPN
jgi:hypothetical protein